MHTSVTYLPFFVTVLNILTFFVLHLCYSLVLFVLHFYSCLTTNVIYLFSHQSAEREAQGFSLPLLDKKRTNSLINNILIIDQILIDTQKRYVHSQEIGL